MSTHCFAANNLVCLAAVLLSVSMAASAPAASQTQPLDTAASPKQNAYSSSEQLRILLKRHAAKQSDTSAARDDAKALKEIRDKALTYGKGSDEYFSVLQQGLEALTASERASVAVSARDSFRPMPVPPQGGGNHFSAAVPSISGPTPEIMPFNMPEPDLSPTILEATKSAALRDSLEDTFALAAEAEAANVPFSTNGSPVCEDTEWPDVVGLTTASGVLCSGVVIAKGSADGTQPGKVLTAGHCVCALGLNSSLSGKSVVIGRRTPLGKKDACNQITPEPKLAAITGAKLLKSDFCTKAGSYVVPGEDVAVVYFQPPAGIDISARKVASASDYGARLGKDWAWIVGFGSTGYGSMQCPLFARSTGHKSWFYNKIISPRCNDAWRPSGSDCEADQEAYLSDNNPWRRDVCRSDSCAGDSGGPVFIMVETTPNGCQNNSGCEDLVAAVVSRSLGGRANVCGPGGIYALVTPEIVTKIENQPLVSP